MREKKPSTKLIHNHTGGRLLPTVNPPIERGSTLLMQDRKAMYREKPSYGRMGLAVHRELETALTGLENGVHTQLTSNGLSACTLAIAACVKAGDHILVTDIVYGPTRRFCTKRLKAMGVEVSFFDPMIGAEIEAQIQDNTTAIFVETPGSLTFELSDLPAISSATKSRNISLIADNTWGAGVYYQPLKLGADISVQALTKYAVGHADAFGGAVISLDDTHARKVQKCAEEWGISLAPDDAYLALRGLRTLHARLAAHEANALKVAEWLNSRELVDTVLHPALASHPDHELWRRDYTGSCGLFSVLLKDLSDEALDVFLSGFELFGFGFSWGGYESLLNPADGEFTRSLGPWGSGEQPGRLIRLHIGLEDPDDLISDLEAAFGKLKSHLST